MRPRTLLILAGVVGALGAFIWFFERELPSSDERTELAKRLVSVEAEAVEAVVIEWGDRFVELRREEEAESGEIDETELVERDWRLQRPMVARADSTAVSGLVRRLAELEKERTLHEVTRADVGLAEPRARVTLSSSEGDVVLEVGAEIPASGNMTLAVSGREEVYVVASSIYDELSKEPGDWRDKSLFVAGRNEIDRLTLSSGDSQVVMARQGEEFWVQSPLGDRADADLVSALLTQITSLRAESFVDEPMEAESELGLGPGAATLEVAVRGDDRPWRLELGALVTAADENDADKPARHARLGQQIVVIQADLGEHLERSAADWRSLDLAASEVYRIERALVEDATGEVEVRREADAWLRDGEKIGYGPATDLLFEITGARAARLIGEPDGGLGEPEVTVTLESDDGTREAVQLFASFDDQVPARVSGREVVLMLASETVNGVRDKIASLRSAQIELPESEPEASADGGARTED